MAAFSKQLKPSFGLVTNSVPKKHLFLNLKYPDIVRSARSSKELSLHAINAVLILKGFQCPDELLTPNLN